MYKLIPFQVAAVAIMRMNEQTGALQPNWLLEGGTAELEEGHLLCIIDGPGADQMLDDGSCELNQLTGYPFPLTPDAFEMVMDKEAEVRLPFYRPVGETCSPDFRASIVRRGGDVCPLYKADTLHAELLRLASAETRSAATLALSQLTLDQALILLRRAAGEPGLNSFLRGDMDRFLQTTRLTAEPDMGS